MIDIPHTVCEVCKVRMPSDLGFLTLIMMMTHDEQCSNKLMQQIEAE